MDSRPMSRQISKRSSQSALVDAGEIAKLASDKTERGCLISDSAMEAMESQLRPMVCNGFVSDLYEVQLSDLKNPKSIQPWSHLPFKLYRSATLTRMFSTLLDHIVPGTPVTYEKVLEAIMQQSHTDSFCYLIGGQVRDMLKGKISKDVDFNYACTAKDVATVCVNNEWTVKYKPIGPVAKPNYVLIGDEQSELYMEGFSTSFNATSECFKQDFRQNMLFYDLANGVILDKSGCGVSDVRNGELRLACAPNSQQFDAWASADMSLGQKALRYVKFVVRAQAKQAPLKTDNEEVAYVVGLLKRAFRENEAALNGFWFGYVLGECLSTKEGVQSLHKWVCDVSGPLWWEEWMPFVKSKVGDTSWLTSLSTPTQVQSIASDVKRIFASADFEGNGLIKREALLQVMRKLNVSATDKDLDVLFASAQDSALGDLRYDALVDSLLGLSQA